MFPVVVQISQNLITSLVQLTIEATDTLDERHFLGAGVT